MSKIKDQEKALTRFKTAMLQIASASECCSFSSIGDIATKITGENLYDLRNILCRTAYYGGKSICKSCPLADYWKSFEPVQDHLIFCYGWNTPFRKLIVQESTEKLVRECCLSLAVAAEQRIKELHD